MTHSNPTLEQVAMLQTRSERLQRLREMLEVLIASEARVGPLELGALLEVADSVAAPPTPHVHKSAAWNPKFCECGQLLVPLTDLTGQLQSMQQTAVAAPPPTDAPDDGDPNPLPECPMCGANGEASVQWVEDRFKYGVDGPKQIELVAVIPLWTCNTCGESWTDYHAEDARDSTVRKHLSSRSKPPVEQPTDAPGVDLEAAAFDYWPPGSREDFCRAVPLSVAQAALQEATVEIEMQFKWVRDTVQAALGDDKPPFSAFDAVALLVTAFKEQRTRAEAAETALAEAAREINCAGPVAHRIRVLRQEMQTQVESAEREAARLRNVITKQADACHRIEDELKEANRDRDTWKNRADYLAELDTAGLREIVQRLACAFFRYRDREGDTQPLNDMIVIAGDAAALLTPPHAGGEEETQ
jgi:hypothetical protein